MIVCVLVGSILAAEAEAPISQVTVFADQARVVRTLRSSAVGVKRIELARLPDTVDASSIRVEATGADIRRVDIEHLEPERLRSEESRALTDQLEQLDLQLDHLAKLRELTAAQRDALLNVEPAAPENKTKLMGTGWAASQTFLAEQAAKLQRQLRETDSQLEKVRKARLPLAEKAKKIGDPVTRAGWKVTATIEGHGPATLTCTYLVANAKWSPLWNVQLLAEKNLVNVSLAGLVSQDTTEDWTQAALQLSTSIPSHAVKAPVLSSWKLGTTERFIPSPQLHVPPPPTLVEQGGEGAVFIGKVTDAATNKSVRDVVLTLTSPALKGEATAVTDHAGAYRFGSLPTGVYTFTAEAESFARFTRTDLTLKAGRTMRMNISLRSVPGAEPTIDVASTSAGVSVGKEFINNIAVITPNANGVRSFESLASSAPSGFTTTFSLSPPQSWQPRDYGAESPVTLAGGADLTFAALQKETIPTAGGVRRVALWSAQWPVSVERKVFPALSRDVFLVAELKNPSTQTLPGGPALLSVGADPSGQAQLKLVSSGEAFTLPLGIDRAVTPIRNVQLLEETRGFISKDEVGTYRVTIELANPYPTPIVVRVADQWPQSSQKEVEVSLVATSPSATRDEKKGWLEWRATIAAHQTSTFTFTYTIKRPKGWKLRDAEVQP